MKIVFVRPQVKQRWMIIPPLGLGYLAAAAKTAGHEVKIYDAWLLDSSPQTAAYDIRRIDSGLIGVQVFYDTVDWTRAFIAHLKNWYHPAKCPPIMLGGPQMTAFPELAKELGADIGIQGEAEYLWHGKQPFDVNSIPMPDWDSFDLPAYWPYMYNVSVPVRGKRPVNIQRTRGCPFKCTFCAGHITHGYPVRFRDDANVIQEILYLIRRWNIDEIWFQDDNVIVNYDRGIELFERLKWLKLHIRLPSGIRIENVNPNMVHAMKRAGVYYTGVGIESGNERVSKRIKKHLNLNKARDAIALLSRTGIKTNGFFIFGLPTETGKEMQDTLDYALSTKLHHAQFGIFIKYPGSEDYNETPLLPPDELVKIQRHATLKFYWRPRIIWNMIKIFKFSQIMAFFKHPWVKKWWKLN